MIKSNNHDLANEIEFAHSSSSQEEKKKEQAPLPAPPLPCRDTLFDKEEEPFTFSWQEFVEKKFFISGGWDLEYYYTIRGSENFHIYLWIAKDLSWSQDWYWPSLIFGTMAMLWCLVLAYHAMDSKVLEEVYMIVAVILWLAANFVWMSGEVFNGDDDYVYPRVAIMMETAIAWILFLHVVLRPLGILNMADYDDSIYSRPGLHSRFSYFKYWRQYEHAHTLCWLGKDLSWNQYNPYTWVICFIPTFFLSLDFIYTTFKTKRMMEDCVHYFAQLIWVIGNMMWALGNIYILEDDTDDAAYPMFNMNREARARMRNWGSWVLLSAYFPLIILYVVWIPMTFEQKFDQRASVIHLAEQRAHALRVSQWKASIAAKAVAGSSLQTVQTVQNPLRAAKEPQAEV